MENFKNLKNYFFFKNFVKLLEKTRINFENSIYKLM